MKKYIFVLIATAFFLIPQPKAYAAVSCSVTENSSYSSTGLPSYASTQVSAIVTNTGDQLVRAIRVTAAWSVSNASVSGFGSQTDNNVVRFVDGLLNVGGVAYVNVNVETSGPQGADSIHYEISINGADPWSECSNSPLYMAVIDSGPTPLPPGSYEPDESVLGAATDLLTSMVEVVFTVIPIAIGIVGTLIVTLFAIRHLRGFFWKFQKWTRGKKGKR
jgi:hypothetical protein